MTEKLTENELKLIRHLANMSDFNGDTLDFTKPFEEQCLEASDVYESIVELKVYNEVLKTNNAGSRAIVGSLVKKNMIETDNDCGTFWLHIYKEHFNNIVAALKEQGEL